MRRLTKIKFLGDYWFIDERLNQVRKENNPNEFMSLDEFNTLLYLSKK